jgi:hypothetical protein
MKTREELLAERAKIDAELQLLDRREALQKAFGNMGALVDALGTDPQLARDVAFEQCVVSPTKDGECRVFPYYVSVDDEIEGNRAITVKLEIHY